MSAILEIETKRIESQSCRVYPEVWNDEMRWIAVPPEFEDLAVANAPYISVQFADDDRTIIAITPTERPEQEAPAPNPITVLQKENKDLKQQVTDAQLALAELYELVTQGGQ